MSKVNAETDPGRPTVVIPEATLSDADWRAIQEETSLDILTIVMDVLNKHAGASRTMDRIVDQCTAAFRRGALSRTASAIPGKFSEALVECAIPYEALLADTESRKWIAPEIWTAIENAVISIRAIVSTQAEGGPQITTEESQGSLQHVYDDSDPVMAALSRLVEDGDATDNQRRTAGMAMKEIIKLRSPLSPQTEEVEAILDLPEEEGEQESVKAEKAL